MNENMKLYENVRKVPEQALKPIVGGRLKGMSDINPMWRIKMLTEMFGICGIGWRIEIVDQRIERGAGEEIVCFVDINLYIKSDGEWSYPIPGMGGSSFVTQERNGAYTSDECFKMAYTDAISVACKSLGFAADVYFEKDRTKYSNQEDVKAPSKPSQTVEQPKQTDTPTQSQTITITPSGSPSTQVPLNGSKEDAQEVGQQKLLQGQVMGLMKKRGMSWPEMNELCTALLERKVTYFKNIVDVEELKKIKAAMDDAVGA